MSSKLKRLYIVMAGNVEVVVFMMGGCLGRWSSIIIDHGPLNILKTDLSEVRRSQRGEVARVMTVCGMCTGRDGWCRMESPSSSSNSER